MEGNFTEGDFISNSTDVQVSKPFLKRSGAPSKVSPDIKRRRRNYRFKKLLAPKNPLMILNELKNGLIFQIIESVTSTLQIEFTATVEYEPGKFFSGKGASKKLAQQAAAEETLKGLFFEKLLDQLSKKETEDHDIDMAIKEESSSDLISQTSESTIPEDDTPWCSLASLAFYKLIREWKAPATAAAPSASVVPDSTKTSTDEIRKLPENPTQMDPVMLLHQISPNSKFVETARTVRNGEHLFTLSIDFNGKTFEGEASKKKDAKKICAKNALATIGVIF